MLWNRNIVTKLAIINNFISCIYLQTYKSTPYYFSYILFNCILYFTCVLECVCVYVCVCVCACSVLTTSYLAGQLDNGHRCDFTYILMYIHISLHLQFAKEDQLLYVIISLIFNIRCTLIDRIVSAERNYNFPLTAIWLINYILTLDNGMLAML